MSYGIDRLAQEVADAFAANTRLLHDMFQTQTAGSSPIEALFFAAFVAHVDLGEMVSLPLYRGRGGRTQAEAAEAMSGVSVGTIGLFPQCQFPEWRVDFLLCIKSDDARLEWLIVECDGHDFHERTKEQAAKDRSRDREFQAKGYTVFRFTGSELYRSAFEKGSEAYRWLLRKIM